MMESINYYKRLIMNTKRFISNKIRSSNTCNKIFAAAVVLSCRRVSNLIIDLSKLKVKF